MLTSLKLKTPLCRQNIQLHRATSMAIDSYFLFSHSFLLIDQMSGALFWAFSRAPGVEFEWQVAGIAQRVLKTDNLWEK